MKPKDESLRVWLYEEASNHINPPDGIVQNLWGEIKNAR